MYYLSALCLGYVAIEFDIDKVVHVLKKSNI